MGQGARFAADRAAAQHTCDLVMPFLSRSISGDTVSPFCFSRSPWRKNSSSRYCTHFL